MSSFIVVLDACVLIPAPLRDTLLRAAEAGLYRARWSDNILEEMRRNLVSKLSQSEEQAQRLVNIVSAAFPEAMVTGYASLTANMTNHPKDRHVLAAAVVAGAQVIVTSNLKDFPEAALAPFGIEAQAPDDFLISLFDLDPDQMVQVISRQAQDLRNPPKSLGELLSILERQAPGFAARIRAMAGQ
ncbi:MAG: PIN domain-containing protein [Candidatus Binataceae bacterium]